MKLLSVIAALALFSVANVAAAQGKQDFTLVNATGYTINEVYVAPSSSDDWEEDVLGQDQLAHKEYVNIHFERGTKTCKWDLKVVYDDGEKAEWDAFDLCKVSKITIKYDRKAGTTSATYE